MADTDIVSSARKALGGFMSNLPERLPGTDGFYRAYHNSTALPAPAISHCQWDLGDCTGRAVTDWTFLREMVGDSRTGAEVERGQKELLLSLLNAETGLVFTPELSDAPGKKYYYHLWDQGRTLRALVHWHRSLEDEPAQKVEIGQRIERMIDGLTALGVHGKDGSWGEYEVFTSDIYINNEPRPSEAFSPEAGNIWAWGGQLIEPLVEWFEATGEERALRFAMGLANGTLSGRQSDGHTGKVKRALEFGEDGSFTAHFHNRVSVVLGIVKLAETLYKKGEHAEGLKLLSRAKRIYDWIFDPARNINAAGSYGWFPESMQADGNRARVLSETCCTADMIELAAELAKASRLDPSLSDLARLWDDVERFTLNGLMKAQFSVSPEYEKVLARTMEVAGSPAERTKKIKAAIELAYRMDGSFWDVFYPNGVQITRGTNTPLLTVGGCCSYSGVRGLYGCWKNIISKEGRELFVHMSLTRDSEWAKIRSYLPDRGRLDVTILDACNLHYRIPVWVDSQTVTVEVNQKPIHPSRDERNQGYLLVPGLRKNDLLSVSYPVSKRVTKEKIGGNNQGAGMDAGSCDPKEKIEYTISWAGNTVISIEPQGKLLPLFP